MTGETWLIYEFGYNCHSENYMYICYIYEETLYAVKGRKLSV